MKTRAYLNLIPNKEVFMDIAIPKMNINSARWKCQKCGEESEDSFDSCWNCGTGAGGSAPENPAELQGSKSLVNSGLFNSVVISTGDIKEPYLILDAIFAFDSHSGGFFSGANPEKAFDRVKTKLRQICKEMGGDAVINCQFEYRVALATTAGGAAASLFGKALGASISDKSQTIEIFSYGTAVKLKKTGM